MSAADRDGARTRDGADGSGSASGARLAPGNSFVVDTWINMRRWLLKSVRNPFVVVSSVVQPVVFLVLFSQVFGQVTGGVISRSAAGDVNYISFLLPAIVIQVALVAAAGSGIGLVNDIETGMLGKGLVSPMHRGAIFLGKTLAEVARIAVQVVFIVVIGVALGAHIATGPLGVLVIIAIGILFSIWFTAFSNIVGLRTGDTQSTIIAVNFLQLPLLFVSSAFLPVSVLPTWIQYISAVNPITYGVNATRALVISGWAWDTVLPSLAVLVVLDLLLGGVALVVLRRATDASAR